MPDWKERFSIADERALVTGAFRGIGITIYETLAAAGANAVAASRDQSGLELVWQKIRSRWP